MLAQLHTVHVQSRFLPFEDRVTVRSDCTDGVQLRAANEGSRACCRCPTTWFDMLLGPEQWQNEKARTMTEGQMALCINRMDGGGT